MDASPPPGLTGDSTPPPIHAQPTPGLTAPLGFRAASGRCGIKPSGKPDLMLLLSEAPASAAGVFTTNRFPGNPVIVCRERLTASSGRAQAVVCNSGISNVATGQRGYEHAQAMCHRVERTFHLQGPALVCSTGVIGPLLPMDKVLPGIDAMHQAVARGPEADEAAAQAILTTDLRTKHALVCLSPKLTIEPSPSGRPEDPERITLGGIAKGSGMIAPNMATMLAFLTTDARIEPEPLRLALRRATAETFNRISVDQDTSTSDSVLILASGMSNAPEILPGTDAFEAFVAALERVCADLSYQIVKDGEGATKVIHLLVERAASDEDADQVGRAVINSPLVKTAVHGGDPNWGRLIMAVGRSGAAMDPDRLSLSIGGVRIFEGGQGLELSEAASEQLKQAMAGPDVRIALDLQLGTSQARWMGCDLSRDYIAINADYTT